MKSILLYTLYAALIALGGFLFVYGEYDDSPGGQLLGLLVALAGVVGSVREARRNRR